MVYFALSEHIWEIKIATELDIEPVYTHIIKLKNECVWTGKVSMIILIVSLSYHIYAVPPKTRLHLTI